MKRIAKRTSKLKSFLRDDIWELELEELQKELELGLKKNDTVDE